MRPTRTTKEWLVEQLLCVFTQRGYDGATLAHLAAATGLSKASLYHHYPGGKPEIATMLVRYAISRAQRLAFSHVGGSESPRKRMLKFLLGFEQYIVENGTNCLLAIFIHHATANQEIEQQQQLIYAQFNDWHLALSALFASAGYKDKKATRSAHELMSSIYGALLNAKMHNSPELFTCAIERLCKSLGKQLTTKQRT